MFQIQTLNHISPCGLELLEAERYHFSEQMDAPDGILVRSANLHDWAIPDSVMAIARAGVGVNNIPVEQCTAKGVVVFNTPSANANAVKELVIAALLLSNRRIVDGIAWAKSLDGSCEIEKLVEKGKSRFTGPELLGKKLGVIGLGAIGIQVANTAVHLGMEVYGYDPYISVDAAWRLSRNVHRAQDLRELFQNCDYITIHVPYLPSTKGMISGEAIASMKQGTRLLNFERGELVEIPAVISALETGKLAAYLTDFPCQQLMGVPGVTMLPHLGASTPESEDNCAVMAVSQLKDFLENGNLTNSVNYPSLSLPRSAGDQTRYGIFHRNVHGMLTQITSAFAKQQLNIENMTNKSKGDFAYTLLDVTGSASEKDIAALREISGVVRVLCFH